ncbi:hypothetical protein Tco_0658940 [Tanacetum coccineum]
MTKKNQEKKCCSHVIKVIKAIYGEDGNLNKDVSGRVRTYWKSIVHEVRVLQGRGINVADYIRLKLGNGENTRFWVDNWYEGGVIKELFPRMFALELNKNATVSLKLNASSLDNSFRRKARSGIEEMQLNSLAEISRMTTLVPCEDRYVWTLESDGVFSVASIRKEIDGNRFQDIMRKISLGWNIDYSDVNSYEEWRVWLVSIRDAIQLKGVLRVVYYGLWWYMWKLSQQASV